MSALLFRHSAQRIPRRPAAACTRSLTLFETARPVRIRGLSPCSARFLSTAGHDAEPPRKRELRENIYTLPNLLTVSRIAACPLLGWAVVHGDFRTATLVLAYAGATDWIDGYIARRWKQQSVLGTILDPAADKALVTTLTVTLAMSGLLPLPLAVIIIGRDVLLSISAFYYRYISLPQPKTFARYWDFSIPSAEVRPTQISKINTALQLLLMGVTTVNPVLPLDLSLPITYLQWTVGATTIWSGLSYVFSKDAVKILSQRKDNK